jgi:hypothetical protein
LQGIYRGLRYCTRIGISRGGAGGGGSWERTGEDEDGGGEKCEIKVSAGRCMTMGGRTCADEGGGGGEGGRRERGTNIGTSTARSTWDSSELDV